MSTVKKGKSQIVKLTITAMLTAIIIVMAFTPIGYLRIGALSLTLLVIPVIIGAVSQGPAVGAFLGGVFGLTSFAQCFMGDVLGAILASESMVKTFIVCFVPRLLTGFFAGLIYKACAKRDKKQSWSILVGGVSASLLNTILFLGTLALLFMNLTFTPEQAASLGGLDTVLNTVIAIAAGINAPIEAVVCAILGTAIGKGVLSATKKLG